MQCLPSSLQQQAVISLKKIKAEVSNLKRKTDETKMP